MNSSKITLIIVLWTLALGSFLLSSPPPIPGSDTPYYKSDFVNTKFLKSHSQALKSHYAQSKNKNDLRALELPDTALNKINFLVVPVAYLDQSFSVELSNVSNAFLSPNLFSSVSNYYYRQSFGKLTTTFTILPITTLGNTREYYAQGPNPPSSPVYTRLVGDASQALLDRYSAGDFDTNDFITKYDLDSDTYIDSVIFLHSGRGRELGVTNIDVHSHAHQATANNYLATPATNTIGGIRINNYAAIAEIGIVSNYSANPQDWITTGIWCHEIGHLIGLPDLYNTSPGSGSSVIGSTGLMDFGSYNTAPGDDAAALGTLPASINPYLKLRLGWIETNQLVTVDTTSIGEEGTTLTLTPFSDTNLTGTTKGAIVYGIQEDEYWIVDFRGQNFEDAYYTSTGCIIWKINENRFIDAHWEANIVNAFYLDPAIVPKLVDLNEGSAPGIIGSGFLWNQGEIFNQSSTPNSSYVDDSISGINVEFSDESSQSIDIFVNSFLSSDSKVSISIYNPSVENLDSDNQDIRFSISLKESPSNPLLAISDTSGKLVGLSSLKNEVEYINGKYLINVTWTPVDPYDKSNLPRGVYTYHFSSDSGDAYRGRLYLEESDD